MKCRWAVMALFVSLVPALQAREITDMVGRKVKVPDKIERVYSPSGYGTFVMYALAPELISVKVMPVGNLYAKKYLPRSLQSLPVQAGSPQLLDPESIARSHPQILIIWQDKYYSLDSHTLERYASLGIPLVYIQTNGIETYPTAIRFLGKLLGREKRAELLAQQTTRITSGVRAAAQKRPAGKRPRVYYAEGIDGLSTECSNSLHAEVLQLAGDVNMMHCHASSMAGFEKVSLEQLVADQPDVIFVQERLFYNKVYSDPVWQHVKAVREHKVYYIPHLPFNWFDRPPSIMRLIGLQWVASILYPAEYRVNIQAEIKNFYRIFWNVNLSDQDLRAIMQ